jgi:hypothetical protein
MINTLWRTLGLACLSLAVTAAPTLAQIYNGNSIYKITRSNGTTSIVVAGQTAGQRIAINYANATRTRRVTANACGLITLRDTSSNPLSSLVSVDGETIDQGALPQQLLPRCVNGTLEEARTAHFRTGAGEVVLVKTPNTVYQAVYSGGRTRNTTVNACGFAQANSTSTYQHDQPEYASFEINGTTYDFASIPEATPAPLCRTGTLYIPADWP